MKVYTKMSEFRRRTTSVTTYKWRRRFRMRVTHWTEKEFKRNVFGNGDE